MQAEKVAVIGSGLVGRSWSVVFARAGKRVALYDSNADQLANAEAVVGQFVEEAASAGLIREPAQVKTRIAYVSDLQKALAGASYVQEAVFEKEDVKRAVFKELDRLTDPQIVLASSSSMMPASRFASELSGSHRCLVAHPLNPPHLIPLVEIVPSPFTAKEAIERTRQLMQEVGQVPVVLRQEIAGFLVNRLQGALLNEAFRLLQDGSASVDDIDKAVSAGLGLRWSFMGPFETIDLNAPNGLEDFAQRYGPGFYEVARERGAALPWQADTVADAHRQRRALLPAASKRDREVWRDQRLLALRAHQIKFADKEAEGRVSREEPR